MSVYADRSMLKITNDFPSSVSYLLFFSLHSDHLFNINQSLLSISPYTINNKCFLYFLFLVILVIFFFWSVHIEKYLLLCLPTDPGLDHSFENSIEHTFFINNVYTERPKKRKITLIFYCIRQKTLELEPLD